MYSTKCWPNHAEIIPFKKEENSTIPLFPFAHDEVRLQGWPPLFPKSCLATKNLYVQQADWHQARETYLYVEGLSVTMDGARMKQMLSAGSSLSVIHLHVKIYFPFLILSFQVPKICSFLLQVSWIQRGECHHKLKIWKCSWRRRLWYGRCQMSGDC